MQWKDLPGKKVTDNIDHNDCVFLDDLKYIKTDQ